MILISHSDMCLIILDRYLGLFHTDASTHANIFHEYSRSRQCEYAMVKVRTCNSLRVLPASTRVSVKQPLVIWQTT